MIAFGAKKTVLVLIDPDKVSNADLDLLISYQHVPFCWLVGGSLLMSERFEEVVDYLKKHSKLPVVLFPGNNMQLSKNADALLFLSLLSGRNPEYLIGQQVIAAPLVKKSGVQSIPTAYLIIDGGKETSVTYISNTKPIPRDKPEIALATAMAAELLGKKLIYLETGSGAQHHVPLSMISQIKNNVNLPLIVGGGVRNLESLQAIFEAGADHVVIGNHLEKNPDFLNEVAELQMNLVD
jgi:phosphoglycerol geranylgeranyltransferase